MSTQRRKRVRFLILGLLVLAGVAVGSGVLRKIEQQRLNQTLITAIGAYDASAARRALDEGADPNTVAAPLIRIDPQTGEELPQTDSFWSFVQDLLRGVQRTSRESPALATALIKLWYPVEDTGQRVQGVAIVKALLDHGAYVDSKTREVSDMISYALEAQYDGPQLLRLLLQHSGNVAHRSNKGEVSLLDRRYPGTGRTPLRSAAGWGVPEEVELLIGAGAKIDLADDVGQTALMDAAIQGRIENVACLLKHHAHVGLKDIRGHTALFMARTNRADHAQTSYTQELTTDVWPDIVKMLEQAKD